MKQKLLSILLIGILILGLTGCGKSNQENSETKQNNDDSVEENITNQNHYETIPSGIYRGRGSDGDYKIEIKPDNICHFTYINVDNNIDSECSYTLENNKITFKLDNNLEIDCELKDSNIYWEEHYMTFSK